MGRAIPGLEIHLQQIGDPIRGNFIPALLGCTVEEAVKPDLRTMLTHGVK